MIIAIQDFKHKKYTHHTKSQSSIVMMIDDHQHLNINNLNSLCFVNIKISMIIAIQDFKHKKYTHHTKSQSSTVMIEV